ncbi:hypothetical protein V1264_011216 [Littorina saxatilis]|uniref:Uncharacterized protein n=1 Tax=Littorina saxatilis TaxID=31220 RepID=A0AAN9BSA8_9CAEN
MASDEEDDLAALRLAALATLKKKPEVVDDVQPIPQLTSSGHSLHKSNSPWAEDFSYDTVPFPESQPVPQFQPQTWDQPQVTHREYGQGSPTHYPQNNWRGRGGQGRFQRPYMRGRGGFPPNQRAPFVQNQQPFGHRGSFNRAPRPPFQPNQPFNPAQRPPFGQNPMQFAGAPPRGGGGGNLIVINTLPAEGEQPPGPFFPGQRMQLRGGPNHRGRGRGVRGGGKMGGGPDGNNPQGDSLSKPMLLRPQDKYCPTEDNTGQPAPEPAVVRRKKKDKFSRFDSSGSESDDESEEDSEEEQPAQRCQSMAADEDAADNSINNSYEEQLPKDIIEAEISISAVNTSQLDSDKETEEQELEELEEPVIENLGDEREEAEEESEAELNEESEAELNEEEEAKLLAPSPTRDSEVRSTSPHSPKTKRQSSVEKDPSPAREPSPAKDLSPTSQHSEHNEKSDGSDVESSSDNNSESGNESDTSSSGSSSGSQKGEESGSGSSSEAESEQEQAEIASVGEAQSLNQNSHSDSESETEMSIRRLPAKRKVSTSTRRSLSPKKPEVVLTPEEQARLDARRRKFETSQEVKVTGNTRTISLKGIVPKTTKKTRPTQSSTSVTSVKSGKPSVRTVQARTAEPKTSASDAHRKHARRKVSIERPPDKSSSGSEAENKSDSESEDEDEENSRAWRREANKNPTRRKTANIDQPLLGSGGGYHGNSYRGSSRNGGSSRRGYGASRDTRPEVHYSSSDDDENGRKLISVVVPRSSAGTRFASGPPRGDRDKVSTRKRTVSGGNETKSKRFPDREGSGSISVVISGDPSAPKRFRPESGSRVPIHARLGKGSKQKTDSRTRSRSSDRSNARPASRKQPRGGSDDEKGGNHNELDLRIRRIKKNNAAILKRQEEIQQDRELYG